MLLECADVLIVTALVLIAAAFVGAFGHPRRTRTRRKRVLHALSIEG
jgi:hypothetical protein